MEANTQLICIVSQRISLAPNKNCLKLVTGHSYFLIENNNSDEYETKNKQHSLALFIQYFHAQLFHLKLCAY